jgi:16S rRNA processing protein RimM
VGERADPPFVVVGHITRPHGTKGEFFIWSLTDRPDDAFVEGGFLTVARSEGDLPDDLFPPLRIRSVRPFRKGFLLCFEGIHDRNAAEMLRDRYLLRPFAEIPPLEEGEAFYHQLLGAEVVTREGRELGKVREVYPLRPTDLLEVVAEDGSSTLIPYTSEVIVEFDAAAGRVVVDPPEGLLDL